MRYQVERLSKFYGNVEKNECVLVIVGSFAPFHAGHVDAINSAYNFIARLGKEVNACLCVPNSDEYVLNKVNNQRWDLHLRIDGIVNVLQKTECKMNYIVDDITGECFCGNLVTDYAIANLRLRVGEIQKNNIFVVVGSDKIEEAMQYLNTYNIICVRRPGYDIEAPLCSYANVAVIDRMNMACDISSTDIRMEVNKADEY